MSSLKTQFITHNPFSTCLEIPHYAKSRTVRLQALGWGQGLWEVDGSGHGNITAKVILRQGLLPQLPHLSPNIYEFPSNISSPLTILNLDTKIFIFTIWASWVFFVCLQQLPPSILYAPRTPLSQQQRCPSLSRGMSGLIVAAAGMSRSSQHLHQRFHV